MTRSVPEWIGATDDTPPPPRVKLRVIDRQGGKCGCGCGVKLGMCGEVTEFDHIRALINGGENRESNLRALRFPCHRLKTADDVQQKAAVARKRKKDLLPRESANPLPGGRRSKWKAKIGGGWERREE